MTKNRTYCDVSMIWSNNSEPRSEWSKLTLPYDHRDTNVQFESSCCTKAWERKKNGKEKQAGKEKTDIRSTTIVKRRSAKFFFFFSVSIFCRTEINYQLQEKGWNVRFDNWYGYFNQRKLENTPLRCVPFRI